MKILSWELEFSFSLLAGGRSNKEVFTARLRDPLPSRACFLCELILDLYENPGNCTLIRWDW